MNVVAGPVKLNTGAPALNPTSLSGDVAAGFAVLRTPQDELSRCPKFSMSRLSSNWWRGPPPPRPNSCRIRKSTLLYQGVGSPNPAGSCPRGEFNEPPPARTPLRAAPPG